MMTGDDVLAAEAECRSFLVPHVEADWSGAVPGLDHTVASVVAHAANGPLWYALDLWGGPGDDAAFDLKVRAGAANDALMVSLRSAARVCAASVDAAPAGMRGFHPAGAADASGFAAMACDEMLIHTDDAARGLGLTFTPDGELAGRVAARLFPWHDRGAEDQWQLPRWANGRTDLPGRPSQKGWKWHCAPLADWDGRQPPLSLPFVKRNTFIDQARRCDEDLAARRHRGVGLGACRAGARSGSVSCGRGLEGEEVSDADDPQHLPLDGADAAPGLVVVQARRGQLDEAPAGPQLAAAGRQDVLDPVGVRAVGQGQDVAVLDGEDVDRRLVHAPGAPATVHDHAETGHPGGDAPGHLVQPGLVPLPYYPRNWHAASPIAASALTRIMRGSQPSRKQHPTRIPSAPPAPGAPVREPGCPSLSRLPQWSDLDCPSGIVAWPEPRAGRRGRHTRHHGPERDQGHDGSGRGPRPMRP